MFVSFISFKSLNLDVLVEDIVGCDVIDDAVSDVRFSVVVVLVSGVLFDIADYLKLRHKTLKSKYYVRETSSFLGRNVQCTEPLTSNSKVSSYTMHRRGFTKFRRV